MGGVRPQRSVRAAVPPLTGEQAIARVAAVDLGTNSTRLLICDAVRTGSGQVKLRDIERIETVTGLGRGVDSSGRLATDAIERTAQVLRTYGHRIRDAGVTRARAIATSAARDATNQDDFLKAARQALGFQPDIITGFEEAALVFSGATGGLSTAKVSNTVVVDIGGGSTEIVTDRGGVSIDIGSIRLTERCLPSHPATTRDLAAARQEGTRLMNESVIPHLRSRGMGVAGTWTSLAAIHLDLNRYDPEKVESTTLVVADIERMVTWLGTLTLKDKQAIRALNPARAPMILGGAIVAETAMHVLGLDKVEITSHDTLDGVCLSLLE